MNLHRSITSLNEGFKRETLAADENQDLSCVSKAATFLRTIAKKESSWDILNKAQKKRQEDYKKL